MPSRRRGFDSRPLHSIPNERRRTKMWIMTSYGILMPALRPETDRATYPLQVRARDKRALKECIRQMDLLELPHTKIYATPQLDYDFRFYTTHNAFALVMASEIEMIDYEKFKPTSYFDDLHILYNHMWSVIFTHYHRRRKGGKQK